MLLSNPKLFATVEALEGPDWAARDRLGGSYTLTSLLEAYAAYDALEADYGPFNAEAASLYEHSGVVYGEGGMARYVLRGSELVLEGSSTHEAKRVRAHALGIPILTC